MTWAVLWAKPKQDLCAIKNLEDQGFSVYRPLTQYRHVDTKRHRVGQRIESLFGRYFFFRFDPEWRRVRNTRGVGGVIMLDEKPSPVPDSEVERIRKMESKDGIVQLKKKNSRFNKNEKVRAVYGPMSGKVGLFSHMTVKERVNVLFDMLGRKVSVEIEERDLELA